MFSEFRSWNFGRSLRRNGESSYNPVRVLKRHMSSHDSDTRFIDLCLICVKTRRWVWQCLQTRGFCHCLQQEELSRFCSTLDFRFKTWYSMFVRKPVPTVSLFARQHSVTLDLAAVMDLGVQIMEKICWNIWSLKVFAFLPQFVVSPESKCSNCRKKMGFIQLMPFACQS